jgi:LysR family transcriptional regulator, transcriptional activator of nhaA
MCHEDNFDDLLADLALHRLDVVLSDRPAPANPNLRLYSHALGSSHLGWYAPAALVRRRPGRDFPRSLERVPVLLPTAHASVRLRLDQWFERHGLQPRMVGEFEDSALLATFGSGHGGASRLRPHARAGRAQPTACSGWRLRWGAGALLRHRHRAQGPAPAGAAPARRF